MIFKNIKSHTKLITISFSTLLIIGLFIFIIFPFPITNAKENTLVNPFNLSLSLEENLVESSDKLIAEILLRLPEEVPTFVDLTFIILNNAEREVYREKINTTVVTDVIMSKTFKGLELPRGKYTLVLETIYNKNISEEFIQEFRIGRDAKQITGEVIDYIGDAEKWGLFGFLSIILIVVLIWYHIFKRKEGDWEKLFKQKEKK